MIINCLRFPTQKMFYIFCISPQQIKDAVALCELFAWLEKEVFLKKYFPFLDIWEKRTDSYSQSFLK